MRERTTEATNPIEQEFLSVIREYERVIYKVCYLYTNPNAPLNDLYQDVILNLWKAYPKFRRECKMSTWIYRIALNTCISFFRKEKNVPEIVTLTREADWIIEEHDPNPRNAEATLSNDQSTGTTRQINYPALS